MPRTAADCGLNVRQWSTFLLIEPMKSALIGLLLLYCCVGAYREWKDVQVTGVNCIDLCHRVLIDERGFSGGKIPKKFFYALDVLLIERCSILISLKHIRKT